MSRPSLVVLALVLALSSVAVAGAIAQESGTTTPLQEATPGEPNYLSINASDVSASNTTTIGLDVGTAIAADSGDLRSNYAETRFRQAYTGAETDANRTEAVRVVVDRLENASQTLRERNADHVQAFARGSLSASAFVRERAQISARAATLQSTASTIQTTVSRDPMYSTPPTLASRLSDLGGELEALQGPVSETARQELVRGESSSPIYAETSDSGYTLARVDDGLYVRETYLGSQWRPDQPDQFVQNTTNAVTAAETRAMELYPWVRTNHAGGSAFDLGGGIYRVRRALPQGELTIYLSGGSAEVFRESQARTVTTFNTTESVNQTQGSTRLTVNRSFETGPAVIELRDTRTGAPINGSVAIGNRDPVWLGDDGRHWIVDPRGEVGLNATAGTTRFSTTLEGS